jgi:prophage regulatory protein
VKIEIHIPDEAIGQFARAFAELMGPMLVASVASGAVAGASQRGVDPSSRNVRPRGMSQEGFLRLKEVLDLIPVSKSTWYKGVKEGRYPKPTDRFGSRIAAWDAREIYRLMEADTGRKGEALSA